MIPVLTQFRRMLSSQAETPEAETGIMAQGEAPVVEDVAAREALRIRDGARATLGKVPGEEASGVSPDVDLDVYRRYANMAMGAVTGVASALVPSAAAQTEEDGLTDYLMQQPGVGVEASQGLMSPPAARPDPAPEYVDPDEGRSWLDKELDTIMVSEGGFQQWENDSGNYVGDELIGTNRGVTPKALAKYRGIAPTDVTVEMMQGVTDAEAREIFKQDYYYAPKIDQLPENLQDTVFDMYINSGSNAIKILQRMVGADEDGVIGPQTLAAVADANITRDAYADARIEYYKSISKPGTKNAEFRQGWINRANKYRD